MLLEGQDTLFKGGSGSRVDVSQTRKGVELVHHKVIHCKRLSTCPLLPHCDLHLHDLAS